MDRTRTLRRIAARVALAGALALVAAACGTGGGAPAGSGTASTAANAAAGSDFPTGPAVRVPAGFQPSKDHVDRTGAYLPANGKPTLVYVDAIW